MQYRSTNTLAGKIFIASSLIILAALVLTGTLGYWQAQRALESQVHSHVNGVLGERRARVKDWMDERKRDLISFCGTDEITQEIASHLSGSGVGGDSRVDLLVERLPT